jgi:hypothetical protein
MSRFVVILAAAQAIYFGLSGLWPLVSMRTFLEVTGPKTDLWLVKTVGLLVVAVAIALGAAAMRGRVPMEIGLLALASSAFLAAVDINYVAKKVISKVYLMDAAAEIVLMVAWLACWNQWMH